MPKPVRLEAAKLEEERIAAEAAAEAQRIEAALCKLGARPERHFVRRLKRRPEGRRPGLALG